MKISNGKKKLGKKVIDAKFFKGTEQDAITFAKEKSNANRLMEQPAERAKIYRKMRESGKSKKEIQEALKDERGNKIFIENLSYLNPKGKAIETLNQFSKSGDRTTQKVIEKIADFTGEARRKFNDLTDAHENEIYNYLYKNEKKIPSKAEFIDLLNRRINGIDEFRDVVPISL